MQNENIYYFEGDQSEDQENKESLWVKIVNPYDDVVDMHDIYGHHRNSCKRPITLQYFSLQFEH